MRDETVAIHGGYIPGSTRAAAVPIYQTVANDFDSAAHAGAVFDLEVPGFHYNRLNNPTNDVLEQRLAQLEHGTAAVTVASGSAAVTGAVLNLTAVGDNIVCAPQLYGATYTYFAHVLPRQGIEVRFADDDRAGSMEPLIDEATKAIFCETVGNPAGNIADLEALAELAHGKGIPLIADNTVASPLRLKPIDHGADVVVHSLTKFVGGHGTTLGGAVIDGGTFPWADHADRFPGMTRPEPAFHGVVYAERFPDQAFAVRFRTVVMRNLGPALSPFNAFLFLQGLETLAVRLERHESNARLVARYLAADPRVEWVSFWDFPDHPYHELAARYLGGHALSIVNFGPVGGYEVALRVYDSVRLFRRQLNMGDVKSLVTHPASTTHRQLSREELAKAKVPPEAIRLSVGLEHPDDLLSDLDQALAAAQQPVG